MFVKWNDKNNNESKITKQKKNEQKKWMEIMGKMVKIFILLGSNFIFSFNHLKEKEKKCRAEIYQRRNFVVDH